MKDKTLKVTLITKPSSTDPLDYDFSIHHNVMRSVYASLVSVYKTGEIAPQIASSWKVNNNQTVWELELNKDWTFLNGDKVTPEIVAKNFKRVLSIKNKIKSESGLLEFLIDSKKIKNISDEFEGIKVKDNKIIFHFNKSMPDFLNKISFGLYAIAHPSDYNEDGSWKDKKKINSSGIYYISDWREDSISLDKRKATFIREDANSISSINFIFPKDQSKILDSGMVFLDRLNPKVDENNWQFISSALDNKMIYVQVLKWEDKNSPFSSLEFRKYARSAFYRSLIEAKMIPETSFFPKTIQGIKSFELDDVNIVKLKIDQISTQPFVTSDYKKTGLKKTRADYFSEAFYGLCEKLKAKPVINQYPENENDDKKVFDIQYLGTGIDIVDSKEDIRFMFKSKHGIKLPDSTGDILKIIENDFNVQDVNQLIWEQAIVWPILHYSTGFWIRKDIDLDLSELNISLTPIDFQFVRWK